MVGLFLFRPISYPDCAFKDVILFDSLSAEIYSLAVASHERNESLHDTQVTVVVTFDRVDRLASEYTYRIMFFHKWRNPACQQLGKKRKHNVCAYSSTDRIEFESMMISVSYSSRKVLPLRTLKSSFLCTHKLSHSFIA